MLLKKLKRYGPANTHDAIKFVAIILMIIDHIGVYFFPEQPAWRAIGRASAPIWFYLVGRYPPSKFKWDIVVYFFVIGVASLIIKDQFYMNILISLLLARGIIWLVERNSYEKQGLPNLLMLAALFYLPFLMLIQYSTIGVVFALCGYLHRISYKPERSVTIFFFTTWVMYMITQQMSLQLPEMDLNLMVFFSAAVMYWLYGFELHDLKLKSRVISVTVALLGRYSLEIYTIHLLVFFWLSEIIR